MKGDVVRDSGKRHGALGFVCVCVWVCIWEASVLVVFVSQRPLGIRGYTKVTGKHAERRKWKWGERLLHKPAPWYPRWLKGATQWEVTLGHFWPKHAHLWPHPHWSALWRMRIGWQPLAKACSVLHTSWISTLWVLVKVRQEIEKSKGLLYF